MPVVGRAECGWDLRLGNLASPNNGRSAVARAPVVSGDRFAGRRSSAAAASSGGRGVANAVLLVDDDDDDDDDDDVSSVDGALAVSCIRLEDTPSIG